MLELTKTLAFYYRERFRPFPWLILPFVLSVLFVGSLGPAFWQAALYFGLSLLFFRLFDDLGTHLYDGARGKKRSYLNRLQQLEVAVFLPLGLLLSVTFFWLGLPGIIWMTLFILLSGALYLVGSPKRPVLFVSILKYPFLGALVMGGFDAWILVGFSLFLLHELIEEKFLPFPKATAWFAFIVVLGSRVFWSQFR
ncbi:MAG: hypothetical protein JNL01_10060 [Bdellovibrionales bacterium]|nr:hypothetical protein [Bdellovibrionales bacterium]